MNSFLDYTILEWGNYKLTTTTTASIILLIMVVRLALFFLKRLVFAIFKRKGVDEGRKEAIYLLIKYITWSVVAVASLEMVGIHVTILIAGSAALLVGLGLGLQQIFQDLVSGVFILIEGTIKVNPIQGAGNHHSFSPKRFTH